MDYLYNGRDGVVTDDNGLYQMRARYYSPELRRFMNEDEYVGKYDDILNINLYAYCEGNPVGFVDPSGYDHEVEVQPCWKSGTTEQDIQATLDFLFLDAINTLQDPSASAGEKAFAAATLIPTGKVIKIGSSLFLKTGKKIAELSPEVIKIMGASDEIVESGSKVLEDGLGTYAGQAGHHPMAKSAFKGVIEYDYKTALTISQSKLTEFGVEHVTITGQQNALYSAFGKTGQPLTMDAMQQLEIKALTNSGVPLNYATNAVNSAIEALYKSGVTQPSRIPWGK